MKKSVLIFSIFVLSLSTSAQLVADCGACKTSKEHDKKDPVHASKKHSKKHHKKLVNSLNLSPKQRKQFEAITKAYHEQRKLLKEEYRANLSEVLTKKQLQKYFKDH